MDGLRLEKTAGGVTTEYQYVNGQLLGEKRSDGVVLRYTYDALGALSGIQYKNAAGVTTNYIVRCTLSGDVDQIFDTKGSLVARYIYDTWGNTLSVTDASGKAITDPLHIANINPIRYRGYYYDAETGLYYLQSRYYDAEIKRFINADEILGLNGEGARYNLFAYCGNNPIQYVDSIGQYPVEVGEDTASSKRDYSGICYALFKHKVVDITSRLDHAMKENATCLKNYYNEHNYIETAAFFAKHVQGGGEWDLKSQDSWSINRETVYLYNGKLLRYDDIGNIHYGYVGRVVFSETLLLVAAGAAQIADHSSKWSYYQSYFDDPRDQAAIRFGYHLWDAGGVS